jgi:hypothetical protein
MFTKLCATCAIAALPLLAACDTRSDSTPVEKNRSSANTQPADSSSPAAATARDHETAGSADKSDKTTAAARPAARLSSSEPEYREVTLPAGTLLPLALETTVASDTSNIEDPVRATLRRAIVVDGVEAVPAGSTLAGTVTEARRSARVKGRARVAFRFNSVHAHDDRVDVRTSVVARTAPATKRQDAAKIGIGAGAGAVIGGIVGGGDGAVKGAAIGGAGGTGVVLATRGKEVRLPAGTNVSVKLLAPVTVRVPVKQY